MIKIYNYVVQGSEEWYALRCGILTASEMKHLVSPKQLKSANNDKSRSHMYELLAQRITNYVEPKYISDDMLRGSDDEIYARDLYDKKYAKTQSVGFVTNSNLGFVMGCSPDGLVGNEGLIEIKSRSQKYQIETIINNEVPSDYIIQIQTALLVTERKWCDFISYCGGLPMYVKRVLPDAETQSAICEAACAFEKRLIEKLANYENNSKGLQLTERRTEMEILI